MRVGCFDEQKSMEECEMGKALIIGAGGVAGVAVHKCCQNPEVFEEICIASRTKSKCDALKDKLDGIGRPPRGGRG